MEQNDAPHVHVHIHEDRALNDFTHLEQIPYAFSV